jgi:hypothetical protein
MGMGDKDWLRMSADEKMDYRFASWLKPDVTFTSAEAEETYRARVIRMTDAIRLQKPPDRVPVITAMGTYPAARAGLTPWDCMHDLESAGEAWYEHNMTFQQDAMVTPLLYTMPASAYETIDYRLFGLPPRTGKVGSTSYQFNEAEYMPPEEYDALIADPVDYVFRRFAPRMCGAFEWLNMLGTPLEMTSISFAPAHLANWGRPEVRDGVERLMAAGRELLEWQDKVGGWVDRIMAEGFPMNFSSYTVAPFDTVGDVLRGTRGIMMDLYRCPDKVLEVCDRMADATIRWVVDKSKPEDIPGVIIPLHKGADGFMSTEQFETFYWPSLRKVIWGLVDQGFVPWMFAEGKYTSRLASITDLPRGKTVWWFDQTDMAKAKQILGDVCCIQGNVPITLLHAGTADQITEYCKRLFATAGQGGGFILDVGAGPDWAIEDNVHAMIRAAKEYGVY